MPLPDRKSDAYSAVTHIEECRFQVNASRLVKQVMQA